MSKRVPDASKPLDELSFADFLKRVPIREFNQTYIPPAVTIPNRINQWHKRHAAGDPNMREFNLNGKFTKHKYTFLSRVDWRGLLAPLVLCAPTDPAHERYTNHHELKKPEDLVGEEAIRELARNLVESYERSEWARLNPDREPFHRFTALNYMGRPVPFLTRPGWRGLWVHSIYRTSDDMPVEPQNREFRIHKTEEELTGEPAIRLEARKYLAHFDRVFTETTIAGRRASRRKKPYIVHLGPRRQSALKDLKSYVSSAMKMPVADADVLRWVLDQAWIHLLPDDFKSVPRDGQEALWGETDAQAPNPARLGTKSPDESEAK